MFVNIALPSLLIIVFIFPGIVFSRFYYSDNFSNQYFRSSFQDLLIFTIVPTFVMHGTWILFTYGLSYLSFGIIKQIDWSVILSLLSLMREKEIVDSVADNISNNLGRFLIYNITLWSVSAFAGKFAMSYVRNKGYDNKYQILRFRNEWHYIFSGEILDKLDLNISNLIDKTFVSILVIIDGQPVVYTGLLKKYVLSKEGLFQYLYISNTIRHTINLTSGDDSEYGEGFQMPPGIFVIPYEKIENINVTYYDVYGISDYLDIYEQ